MDLGVRHPTAEDSEPQAGTEAPLSEPAIALHDLRKSFVIHHHGAGSLKRAVLGAFRRNRWERREVLKGITLEIRPGETVALIGRNGSGKSTLLSLIARVLRPTSGSVELRGAVAPLLELGAGLHPELTGLENIELYGAILGMSAQQVRVCLDSIVAFAFDTPDLVEKIDTPLRNYSDGMKMRLGFSIAIHRNADILLFDEVLAVGDESFQQKCYAKIAEMQRARKTIIFVSHDMRVVEQVATRVLWLYEGLIRADGPVPETVAAYLAATTGATQPPP